MKPKEQLFSVHCRPDVSPETARALADMLLHAVVMKTPDPIAELLQEALRRAEIDLTAAGHMHHSIERTEAMASLRSWIARLTAAVDPERETVSATCDQCGHVTAYAVEGKL